MNLMDKNVGGVNLLFIGLLEMTIIMFIYGYDKFSHDLTLMLGRKPELYWRICWQGLSIFTLAGILFLCFFNYQTPTLGDYTYPYWAVVLGWLMTISSVICIPICAFITFARRFAQCQPEKVDIIDGSSSTGEDSAETAATISLSMSLYRFLRRCLVTLRSCLSPDDDWGPASKENALKWTASRSLELVACDLTKDLTVDENLI